VTLISDAAHLMTPHGEMGATSALMDGYDLGEAIVTLSRQYHWEIASKFMHHNALSRVVKGYESTMFPRSKTYATMTARNRDVFYTEGAAEMMAI
jgi:2-polyprenyl-6-methoxyphenol hydroxylase-like FAD-dependent oxidoreductase